MTVSANVVMRVTAQQVGDNDLGAPQFAPVLAAAMALVDGTGAGQVDLVYAKERTVASGANDDLDLAGGLTDAFGAAITFAEIVAIAIFNKQPDGTANTTTLTIGGGSNPWLGLVGASGDLIRLPAGGVLLMACDTAAGLGAVTASTADILRIANAAGAGNTYQIVILGRSA